MDQRRGEVEAALHPARVGADAALGGGVEADPLEQVVGALAALGGRDSLQRRLQADQLAAGHQRVERRFLQGDADRGAHRPRFAADVVAGDAGAAAGRQQQRGQHPHRGRLAGPVRAEEAEDFALLDLEVDPLHGEHLAEGALQPGGDDRRHAQAPVDSAAGAASGGTASTQRRPLARSSASAASSSSSSRPQAA